MWSRNAATDVNGKLPHWGFSSSPLVVDDLVIVYAGAITAYARASGEIRWTAKAPGGSYSSPHFATIAAVDQVLLQKGGGVLSVAPLDGSILWEHAWQPGIASIVQPAILDGGDILVTAADEMGGTGMRRIAITRRPEGWDVAERWTSRGLKPYYNDFVVHGGHAYGFDNSILACVDLADGKRKWKGGRYGHGQLVLLVKQNVLLILSEEGELALVSASPDSFQELARFPAIEGKTWNHPVLAGDILLVRNDQEMAAFRLVSRGRN
jgi:outer membrane protein assembly factor BamB